MQTTQPITIKTRCFQLFAVLLILTSAGCGNPDRKKLVGTWQLKHSDKIEKRIAELGDEQPASRMSLQFRSNGGLSTVTNMGNIDSEKAGSWEFLSFDEEQQVMKIKCILNSQETEHEIQFLSEARIKLTPPNMAGLNQKLEFQREE